MTMSVVDAARSVTLSIVAPVAASIDSHRPAPPARARSELDLDVRAHDHRALAWQAEVLGGVRRDVRGGDEQAFAPRSHGGRLPALQFDRGEVVGGVVD